jgi:hypothetical protein
MEPGKYSGSILFGGLRKSKKISCVWEPPKISTFFKTFIESILAIIMSNFVS